MNSSITDVPGDKVEVGESRKLPHPGRVPNYLFSISRVLHPILVWCVDDRSEVPSS